MKQVLGLQQKQQLKMTPKLQQAIKLLHLSASELEEEIKEELLKNPVLVRSDYPKPPAEYTLDNIPEDDANLTDYLYWQMRLTPFSEIDQMIAINIIDGIDENGYLQTSINDICSCVSNVSIEDVTAVLHRIQQFDPVGVGSRNLQECLLLQTEDQLCIEIIENHIELLAQKKYSQIKKLMSIDSAQIEAAIAKITSLKPRPGNIILGNKKSEYVIPDVLVTKVSNKWIVSLNPDVNTILRINESYAKHLQQQHQDAKWLINSLQTRNETLLKVTNWIVKYQNDFLEEGAEFMRPLKLQSISAQLDLNESTISRITTNKFLHTPRGTFELKYFFSSQVSDVCSSTAIKAIINKLISEEPANKPYSDEELRKLMTERNIRIARRTITKYRESLGILASTLRKQGV